MKRIIMPMAMIAAVLFSGQASAQVDKQGSTTRQPTGQPIRSDRETISRQQIRQGTPLPGSAAAAPDALRQDTTRRKRDTARVPTPMPTPAPRDTMRK